MKIPKYICPNCESMAVYQEVSVFAKLKINAIKALPYSAKLEMIDNYFPDLCGCERCGWRGTFDEICEATANSKSKKRS